MLRHVVAPEQVGHRADVVVARLSGASRSLVTAAHKRGDICVNGAPVKPSYPLELGDVLEFDAASRIPLTAIAENIDIPIVYEDDDLLVVDKPAGMITHPAHGTRSGTLVNGLLGYLGTLPGDTLRPGLVHRLDRDTSGLLVIAKTPESLSALGIAMKARDIKREYLGLVHGVPDEAIGTIEGPIGRDPHNRMRYAIVNDGRAAVTHYELRASFPKHSELLFRLETGRTHQIRVHCAAIGHNILNDPVYGREETRFALPGQALHAWKLAFTHPRTEETMTFQADPPAEYAAARVLVGGR